MSEATYGRVMGAVKPDTSVYAQIHSQPEFSEALWQYINRRVSDWRIIHGKQALKENAALFSRIERDFGVERGTLLALWGVLAIAAVILDLRPPTWMTAILCAIGLYVVCAGSFRTPP